MYTCPKCYKLFRDKIGICSKCGFDCSNYETKVREKAASRKGDGGKAEIKRLKEYALKCIILTVRQVIDLRNL